MFPSWCTTSVISWRVGFPAMLNPLSIGGAVIAWFFGYFSIATKFIANLFVNLEFCVGLS